jgi:hypothetical protein
LKPAAARRSLTAITLASGDPSAEHVIVAATRYVREVWDASQRADYALSLSELHAVWQRAAEQKTTWRSAAGPLRVAMLEMQRIGWAWPEPFMVLSDLGQVIALTSVSPKAFAVAAAEGVRRQLARELAGRCLSSSGARVAYEPAIAVVKAKNMTARNKACARSLFCCAIWTGHERHKHGYARDDLCELCGGRDSVFHRL